MGPIEALKLAREKEIEARDFYQEFSLSYPKAREIFFFLMNEEEKHKALIEKKIMELQK